MNQQRIKYLYRVVDQRAGHDQPPLMAVSIHHGVVRRDTLTDDLPRAEDLSNYKLCEPGDIVLNRMRAFQGAIGISPRRGLISPDYLVLRPGTHVDGRYLHHLFRSTWFVGEMVSRLRGIGNTENGAVRTPRINPEDLGDIPVTLPALREQRRIADFLDAETARIGAMESAIGSAQQVLAERFASGLHKAFEGNPSEMKSRQLRRVVKKWIDYRGATPAKTLAGIPLVTARNIIDGLIDLDASPEFIDEAEYGSWMVRGLPQVGDVLLTTEAPLGQVAMITDPAIAVAQRIILLRVDESALSPEWLYWYLQSPQGQFELSSRATGSTALGIKADRLRAVPIPICEPSLMRERLKMIGELDSQFKMLQQPMMCQLAVLAERRQALITAAVTGQVDVTTARGLSSSGGVAV